MTLLSLFPVLTSLSVSLYLSSVTSDKKKWWRRMFKQREKLGQFLYFIACAIVMLHIPNDCCYLLVFYKCRFRIDFCFGLSVVLHF